MPVYRSYKVLQESPDKTVYRTGGSYGLSVPVKQPGTYTMTAYYTDACG
jgi:hypothetical protein